MWCDFLMAVCLLKGLPDEKVINKHMKNLVLIWNACTGDYYHANDNFCPLQQVWAMIGSSNVRFKKTVISMVEINVDVYLGLGKHW